jgi:uncharacterized protein (DUF2147 family)
MVWLAILAIMGGQPVRGADSDILGRWSNSNETVLVEVSKCGRGICGKVLRASASAEADARKAGAPPMVGTQVLRDFEARRAGSWSGRVFVPARNRSYRSTLTRIDGSRIRIDACVLGGLICDGEVWRRAG